MDFLTVGEKRMTDCGGVWPAESLCQDLPPLEHLVWWLYCQWVGLQACSGEIEEVKRRRRQGRQTWREISQSLQVAPAADSGWGSRSRNFPSGRLHRKSIRQSALISRLLTSTLRCCLLCFSFAFFAHFSYIEHTHVESLSVSVATFISCAL